MAQSSDTNDPDQARPPPMKAAGLPEGSLSRATFGARLRDASDAYLVLRAQAGDREALSALYRRHAESLLAWLMRLMGDRATADDISQLVWMEAARTLKRLKAPEAFRVWMFQKARWRSLDQMRQVGRRRALETDLPEDDSLVASGSAEADLTHDQLDRLLARLDPDQRAALHLFYREDMTVAEIATVLKSNPNTIKTRLRRARERLRGMILSDERGD